MKFKFYILFVLIAISCKKNQIKQEDNKKVKSEFSITKKIGVITPVESAFKKDVNDWDELIALDDLINQFKKTSINEAYSNAKDLTDLAKSLKDSIKPEKFDIPSFEARVNVFYNETLRLVDLNSIEDIDESEAINQIKKVLQTYSAINSKINTILKEEALEKLINPSVESFALDFYKNDILKKKAVRQDVDLE